MAYELFRLKGLGRITRIEPQKRNRARRSIWLDGSYSFSLSQGALLQAGLRVGDEVSDVEVERLVSLDQREKAREIAFRYLSYRPRTVKEIADKLKGKGMPAETIAAVIEDLKGLKLLDDRAFARSWIAERLAHRPGGKRLLHRELRQKGVDVELIEEAIDELYPQELEVARELLRKRIARFRGLEPQKLKTRVWGLLLRRGFSSQTAQECMEEFLNISEFLRNSEM